MFGKMDDQEEDAWFEKLEKLGREKELVEAERQRYLDSTTESRYVNRATNIWKGKPVRHYFWWVLHNSIVHPLLGFIPCRATFKLHDWASRKLGGK